ncbi:MAG TPA: hypothetical protein VHJ56_02405 [Candidatus Binatia bacterium]|jgi:hypothetical protein|nr:hypothetical protein [Candidatus Binatia bacterium]
MFRTQSLVIAVMLIASATAFAADTPDPSASSGEAALPSGSKADAPSKPSANDSTNINKDDKDAVATTPVEESKGKPKVAE